MLSLMLATGLWAQNCSNLFFSEYIEGSSFNKAVEIYNPTPNTIDLSNYRLILRGFTASGTTPFTPDTLQLSGMLASGAVYVAAHPQSIQAILDQADITSDDNINFNGNDAIALLDVSLGQIIDAVGDYSATSNPGDEWVVGTGSTKDNTLVRKANVQQGTTNWTVGATQWDVFANNTTTYLGSHTSSCFSVTDTLVVFSPNSRLVYDTATASTINLNLVNLSATPAPFTVDVVLKSGNAALVSGFSTQSVSISGNASVALTLDLTPITGAPEVLVFALRNPSNNLQIGADSLFTLTIDSVPTMPLYTISQVRGNNTDGLPDSLGTKCRVRGTVIGINSRTAAQGGFSFTIFDGIDGIGVFSNAATFGYQVQEGDSLEVTGEVAHFSGLAQMSFLEGITQLGTGTVPAPRVVTQLGEDTESELVRLNNYRTYGQPTGSGNPFTYDITNGTDSTEMVIYSNSGIGTTFPTRFDVIGVGRQFDSGGGTPVTYNRFYQIAPRKQADIISVVGIEEVTSGVAAIFPNPTTNVVNILLDANVQAETVKVFDFTGRLVIEQSIAGENTVKINIGNLNNGLYLVQVATAQGISTHKVVKQ